MLAALQPTAPTTVTAMVLIGTPHPKRADLSDSRMAITKVYASNDGIATVKMINATKGCFSATLVGLKSTVATIHSSPITATNCLMAHRLSHESINKP